MTLNSQAKQLLGVRDDHQWRKRKRREIRQVEKAVDRYLLGSAYTPHPALQRPPAPMCLLDLVKHIKKQLSVKGWGR